MAWAEILKRNMSKYSDMELPADEVEPAEEDPAEVCSPHASKLVVFRYAHTALSLNLRLLAARTRGSGGGDTPAGCLGRQAAAQTSKCVCAGASCGVCACEVAMYLTTTEMRVQKHLYA